MRKSVSRHKVDTFGLFSNTGVVRVDAGQCVADELETWLKLSCVGDVCVIRKSKDTDIVPNLDDMSQSVKSLA